MSQSIGSSLIPSHPATFSSLENSLRLGSTTTTAISQLDGSCMRDDVLAKEPTAWEQMPWDESS